MVFSRTPLCDQAGQIAGAIALFVDVTEQRRVEEELHQANRLQAVGRLAAGIAHEINTPIEYIGDNTTFLKEAFSAVGAYVARARGLLGGLSAPALAELDRTAGSWTWTTCWIGPPARSSGRWRGWSGWRPSSAP